MGANVAPRAIDPILRTTGYSDSDIEVISRVPLWIACFGLIILLIGAILTNRPSRSN